VRRRLGDFDLALAAPVAYVWIFDRAQPPDPPFQVMTSWLAGRIYLEASITGGGK
jgi:hypothetical protein